MIKMITVSVIVNKCHGGLGYSEKALFEYNRRKNTNYTKYQSENIDRTDQIMIEICKELGKDANAKSSLIEIEEIPLIYKNYYTINEYDGLEHIDIQHEKYQLDEIRKTIYDANLTFDDKLMQIIIILSLEVKY